MERRFLKPYLMNAPMSLALYRALECEVLANRDFIPPLLDVGCGDGIFASVLFAEKVDSGIGAQALEIDKARNQGIYAELIECLGGRIPKNDASYQTILSNTTWEHIPDLGPVIRECHRLLAPNGRVHITVPTHRLDRYSVPSQILRRIGLCRFADQYGYYFNQFWRHNNYYGPEDWEALSEKCGFRVVEKKEYGSRGSVAAFDLLLPFALPAFVFHKIVGRWILSQGLRRLYVVPLVWFLQLVVRAFERGQPGAMIYFGLTQ